MEVVIRELGAEFGVDALGLIEDVNGSDTVSCWDLTLAAFFSLRF